MLDHTRALAQIGSDFAQTQKDTTLSSGSNFAGFVASIIGIINTIIPALISIALLIFFVGLVQYVYHSDSTTERSRGNQRMIWGLVALFVLMSLWGILDVAKTSIFPS